MNKIDIINIDEFKSAVQESAPSIKHRMPLTFYNGMLTTSFDFSTECKISTSSAHDLRTSPRIQLYVVQNVAETVSIVQCHIRNTLSLFQPIGNPLYR